MARCRNDHQMDRYARACPTCGAGRDPKWHPANLRNEHDHEARRAAHIMLMTLLAIGLVGVSVAFHSRATQDPRAAASRVARSIQVGMLTDTGDEELELAQLMRFARESNDFQIEQAAETIKASVRPREGPSLATVSDLVRTCRTRGLLGPG